MRRPDALCAACGARSDEHEAKDGTCARTKCQGFSDPYYAFHEGEYGPVALRKSADQSIHQTKAEWSITGVVIWTTIILAVAIVLLYLIGAVFKILG